MPVEVVKKKRGKGSAIPIYVFLKEEISQILEKFPLEDKKRYKKWLEQTGFGQKSTSPIALLPNEKTELACVFFIVQEKASFWDVASIYSYLPAEYYFEIKYLPSFLDPILADLALRLASYSYTAQKSKVSSKKTLSIKISSLPKKKEEENEQIVKAIFWIRDLINVPASHLGPKELGDAAQTLTQSYKKVAIKRIRGNDLLKENYPCVYTVGKGSVREPEIIDIRWGNPKHPQVTLVGKGVCFDSGGLDIKASSAMLLMKKDMGGAAHVLGLASLIIEQELPVSLRVLIGAVENSVSGNAMRPLDVTKTRKGLTVEIGNTDAEGRLVLADLLYEASIENPELIIDYATLTGAARVALGPDVPVFFSNKEELARQVMQASNQVQDPMWQLPLWKGYRASLESKVADINNVGSLPYAGAITAALFLQEFIEGNIPWIHIDLMAWNLSSRPGRPEGGEAMALRAIFGFIKDRYKKR